MPSTRCILLSCSHSMLCCRETEGFRVPVLKSRVFVSRQTVSPPPPTSPRRFRCAQGAQSLRVDSEHMTRGCRRIPARRCRGCPGARAASEAACAPRPAPSYSAIQNRVTVSISLRDLLSSMNCHAHSMPITQPFALPCPPTRAER